MFSWLQKYQWMCFFNNVQIMVEPALYRCFCLSIGVESVESLWLLPWHFFLFTVVGLELGYFCHFCRFPSCERHSFPSAPFLSLTLLIGLQSNFDCGFNCDKAPRPGVLCWAPITELDLKHVRVGALVQRFIVYGVKVRIRFEFKRSLTPFKAVFLK